MNNFALRSFFIYGVITIINPLLSSTPDASGWWDFCLDNTVTYDLFASWLGNMNSVSRVAVRGYLKGKHYSSILDVPCGLCIDYFGFKKEQIAIKYTGMDLTQKLVVRAQDQGIDVKQGSIELIDYQDNSFDVVYCRHILEHLEHYKKAITETIRVAKKEVLVVFFMKPSDKQEDVIDLGFLDGHSVYHNKYSASKFQQYVLSHDKVSGIVWENIDENEVIAHIFLKD